MNLNFDPTRSQAIRAGLVDEATPVARRRRPWRGLALVLAGVLAGTGATTAAFANGRLPMEPSPEPSDDGVGATRIIVLENDGGSDAIDDDGSGMKFTEGLSQGQDPRGVRIVVDAKTGKLHFDYEWADDLREVGRAEMVVTEPNALDLSAHPAEATQAWVTFSCEGGSIAMNRLDGSQTRAGGSDDADSDDPEGVDGSEDADDSTETSISADNDSGEVGTVTVQLMLPLNDLREQVAPGDGCVAHATVVYYAES